jgi:hypothetical protein
MGWEFWKPKEREEIGGGWLSPKFVATRRTKVLELAGTNF